MPLTSRSESAFQKVFGLASCSPAWLSGQSLEELERNLWTLVRDREYATFKIEARRAQKSFPLTSPELNRLLGSYLVERSGKGVNLTAPDLTCHVDIVERYAFLYFTKLPGVRGLPVTTSGPVVALLSGGIDSPVAAYKIMKRGCPVIFVHFHSYPFTNLESQEKVRRLVRLLNQYQFQSVLYRVPFAHTQRQIVALTPPETRVIFYRRFMMRIAERLALREGALALVTGDSIGQVASQTLPNLSVISSTVSMPVLRPLVGDDKEEIIQTARAYRDLSRLHLARRGLLFPFRAQTSRDSRPSGGDRGDRSSSRRGGTGGSRPGRCRTRDLRFGFLGNTDNRGRTQHSERSIMRRFAGTLRGAAGVLLAAVLLVPVPGESLGDPSEAVVRVEQLLKRLETQSDSSGSRPETYVLSEKDLNAFLAFRLRKFNPKGVESVKVRFRQDRLLVQADVDLSKVASSKNTPQAGLLTALLGGRHQVEVDGVLEVEDGRGRYRFMGLTLDGVTFPALLLESLIDRLLEATQLPVDPRQPFSMPYGIKRCHNKSGPGHDPNLTRGPDPSILTSNRKGGECWNESRHACWRVLSTSARFWRRKASRSISPEAPSGICS